MQPEDILLGTFVDMQSVALRLHLLILRTQYIVMHKQTLAS